MKAYLIRLTAAAILAAILRKMTPDEHHNWAVRLGSGLLILITAFAPLVQVDPFQAARAVVVRGYGDPLSTEGVDHAANKLMEELISDAAESYILDKAGEMGVNIEAMVETALQDRYPVPWSVTINSDAAEYQRDALSEMITKDLGIPAERQGWNDM